MTQRCERTQCKREFQPYRRRQRFCSQDCDDLSRKKLDFEPLRRLALSGYSKAEIARQMSVSLSTVRRWIAAYGLDEAWREQRYA